jgi:hypothetical protein
MCAPTAGNRWKKSPHRTTVSVAAIETEMKDAWRETVVAVVTEFGRTARINGTDGTDHGTATVVLLVGGALKGGRVVANWPGLKPANLHDAAISSRRLICAPCSRACSRIICELVIPRWRPRSFLRAAR